MYENYVVIYPIALITFPLPAKLDSQSMPKPQPLDEGRIKMGELRQKGHTGSSRKTNNFCQLCDLSSHMVLPDTLQYDKLILVQKKA